MVTMVVAEDSMAADAHTCSEARDFVSMESLSLFYSIRSGELPEINFGTWAPGMRRFYADYTAAVTGLKSYIRGSDTESGGGQLILAEFARRLSATHDIYCRVREDVDRAIAGLREGG